MSNVASSREQVSSVPPTDRCIQYETDELLSLREMNHRLANTFTVLTIMLRREFAPFASTRLLELIARYEARLVAFGDFHRALVGGASGECLSVQHYIEHLCKALSEAILKPLGIRCEVVADVGELPSVRCERLGLVIAELAMNAAKHAFHGCGEGLVRVELINRNGSWVCVVSDNGDGLTMAPAGAGSRVLKQLVCALGGSINIKSGPGGTSVCVTCGG